LGAIDLLDEYEDDEDVCNSSPLRAKFPILTMVAQEINLVHCRITSIPALRLERFTKLEVCIIFLRWPFLHYNGTDVNNIHCSDSAFAKISYRPLNSRKVLHPPFTKLICTTT
jgi:hypothetical protein